MSSPVAIISDKAVERVRAGHLWTYRGDIVGCDAAAGSVVSLLDKKGKFYGRAFYSSASLIALRLLTRADEPVDRNFWLTRVGQAVRLRQRIVKNTEVYRLIHGEGDGMPSIVVDRYGEIVCLQTLSQGADRIKPLLKEILLDLLAPQAIVERNDSKVRELESLPQQISLLHGVDPGEIICCENGLHFYYQPVSGQKTGAFLDQRENRARVRDLARGKALDCFCYGGSFAIHMAQSCDGVEALDIAETALTLGQRNAQLNHIENIHFQRENVFDRLKLYVNLKKQFDTIVLDPPAFAKNRAHVESALRGYKEINLRAMQLLNAGGLLVTCCCSQLIDETTFLNLLTQAAADARRKVQVIQKGTQSQDHPFLLAMPETYYLKCLFLRILE